MYLYQDPTYDCITQSLNQILCIDLFSFIPLYGCQKTHSQFINWFCQPFSHKTVTHTAQFRYHPTKPTPSSSLSRMHTHLHKAVVCYGGGGCSPMNTCKLGQIKICCLLLNSFRIREGVWNGESRTGVCWSKSVVDRGMLLIAWRVCVCGMVVGGGWG